MIHETYLYGQVSNTVGPVTMGSAAHQNESSSNVALFLQQHFPKY